MLTRSDAQQQAHAQIATLSLAKAADTAIHLAASSGQFSVDVEILPDQEAQADQVAESLKLRGFSVNKIVGTAPIAGDDEEEGTPGSNGALEISFGTEA